MLKLKLIAAALLAQCVSAGVLAKRGDGVHLFNCRPFGSEAGGDFLSIVAYCANDSDCSNISFNLDSSNVCIKLSTTTPEKFHVWEGGNQECTFSTGVQFTWDIPANAQSQPNFSGVGTGSNGFKTFQGFKDDQTNGANFDTHSCTKIYYYI